MAGREERLSTDRRTDLLRLLTGYQPVDADEQSFRDRMLDLAAVALDPFDRYHYEPGHFTASGFVLHPAGDRMLLIHHAKLDRWLQPGGHIDPEDGSPLHAAIREIAEEAGVSDIQPIADDLLDIDIHTFPRRGDQPTHLHFDLRFGFVAVDDALNRSESETHGAAWLGGDELGSERSVLRPATKLLS